MLLIVLCDIYEVSYSSSLTQLDSDFGVLGLLVSHNYSDGDGYNDELRKRDIHGFIQIQILHSFRALWFIGTNSTLV